MNELNVEFEEDEMIKSICYLEYVDLHIGLGSVRNGQENDLLMIYQNSGGKLLNNLYSLNYLLIVNQDKMSKTSFSLFGFFFLIEFEILSINSSKYDASPFYDK